MYQTQTTAGPNDRTEEEAGLTGGAGLMGGGGAHRGAEIGPQGGERKHRLSRERPLLVPAARPASGTDAETRRDPDAGRETERPGDRTPPPLPSSPSLDKRPPTRTKKNCWGVIFPNRVTAGEMKGQNKFNKTAVEAAVPCGMIRDHPGMLRPVGRSCAPRSLCVRRKETERRILCEEKRKRFAGQLSRKCVIHRFPH